MRRKEEDRLSCNQCSQVWQKQGATNCWSSPAAGMGAPVFCPGSNHPKIIEESFNHYLGSDDDARLARVAAQVEGLCYQPVPGSDAVNARWTRVEDTIALAIMMGYRKVGIATCIGLLEETNRLAEILQAQGLEPQSVCCKAGAIDKLKLGLREEEKVRPNTFEPACNPIAQAELLNQAKTDFNLIVGLCVGHDMLFAKYSNAPVSTLVVKDRVSGHNPVAVLYGQNFYYKRLQKQKIVVPASS